jgi:hypothetical protein
MTTKHAPMTVPEALLIKLSAQQRHDFAACAGMCGLDLTAWIVQCADVQAAAAIDALQASQRAQRSDRKKPRTRLRVEPPVTGRSAAESPAAKALADPVKGTAPPPAAVDPAAKDPVNSAGPAPCDRDPYGQAP